MVEKAIEHIKSERLAGESDEKESEFCIYETDMNEVVYLETPEESKTREEREQKRMRLMHTMEESRKTRSQGLCRAQPQAVAGSP